MAICAITGTILNGDGTPNSDVHIRARIRSTVDDLGGQIAGGAGIVSDAVEAYTEDDGTFTINLIQGAFYLFEIPFINLRKEILVPAETTVDFVTLI